MSNKKELQKLQALAAQEAIKIILPALLSVFKKVGLIGDKEIKKIIKKVKEKTKK